MKKEGIEKYCRYCEKASVLSDGDAVVCSRYGVVDASHKCRRFRYDPLKRTPKRLADDPQLEYIEV